MWPWRRRPDLSIVVVVHNMAREAPRTLYSLSAAYQRNIAAADYEVIVVDNGSVPPFDARVLDSLEGNFRLLRLDPAPRSPARAINRGLAAARGRIVGVMIDGARILTPGVLHHARHGVTLSPRAVVATLGWYLGRDLQRWSIECGYDQRREDAMLASIGWPQDGYRLFEIGAFDESSVDGWFANIEESNAIFLSRESWDLLGGFDERFDAPGGGYLNLDTLARAMEMPDSELVILLGEASFHQLHGGIATNQSYASLARSLGEWEEQYRAIRERPYRAPSSYKRTYIGSLPDAVLPHVARALVEPVRGLPLGPSFDRTLWLSATAQRPADPVCAALVDLAETEFRHRRFPAAAAVSRMARTRAPDEPAPQRLLSVVGAWLRDAGEPPDDQRAGFHAARGKACRLLGDAAAAEAEFRVALSWDAELTEAKAGLADLAQLRHASGRQAILVLGMHRSGTSALAGVLCRLGAAPPKKTFMGSDPCNLKGLFEALALATAHDAFLDAAGSCWHDWRRFDLQSVGPEIVAEHAAKIRQVLVDEFEDERLILVKDPRICRFVPYTVSILNDLDVSPVAVLPIRNPLEVALSLKRRNDFDTAKSIMLWLRHVLDAEYHSRGLARQFSSYRALLKDWRQLADLIAEKTGVTWRWSDGTAADVEDFLTTELYHERVTANDPADGREVLELAPRVHQILLEICARGEAPDLLDRLDAARAEFDAYCRGFAAAAAR
jgi:glycosyltransferase involved in cell wall biosynthesis